MTKEKVNQILRGVLDNEGIPVWWNAKFMAGQSPNEVWAENPQRVIDHVERYLDPVSG